MGSKVLVFSLFLAQKKCCHVSFTRQGFFYLKNKLTCNEKLTYFVWEHWRSALQSQKENQSVLKVQSTEIRIFLGSNSLVFTNYIDKILSFLTAYIDIFCGMNVDKKWTFLDHPPTSSCKYSLWTTLYHVKF